MKDWGVGGTVAVVIAFVFLIFACIYVYDQWSQLNDAMAELERVADERAKCRASLIGRLFGC